MLERCWLFSQTALCRPSVSVVTALRLKAARTHRFLSDIVNDAVRVALAEDQDSFAAF